jgi:hypothetical protein
MKKKYDGLIEMYKTLKNLKEKNVLSDFTIKWNEEENILSVYGIPKKVVDFIITPTGNTFQ